MGLRCRVPGTLLVWARGQVGLNPPSVPSTFLKYPSVTGSPRVGGARFFRTGYRLALPCPLVLSPSASGLRPRPHPPGQVVSDVLTYP